jgi:hypothetical protein
MRVQRARKSRGTLKQGVLYDEAAAIRKRAELAGVVHHLLSARLALPDPASAQALVDHFFLVIPPEAAPGTLPGHVELNWKTLITAVQRRTLAFPDAPVPWTMVFGGLVVWEHLWLTTRIDPTEIDAAVLWSLWTVRDQRDMVSKEAIVTAVHAEVEAHGGPRLPPVQIDGALTKLRHLKCIETARSAFNSFWLRACVQLQYP